MLIIRSKTTIIVNQTTNFSNYYFLEKKGGNMCHLVGTFNWSHEKALGNLTLFSKNCGFTLSAELEEDNDVRRIFRLNLVGK